MVSAFVLESNGKISFGRPRPNATTTTKQHHKNRQGVLAEHPASHWRRWSSLGLNKASTAVFFFGTPFMLLALVHLLTSIREADTEQKTQQHDSDQKPHKRQKVIQNRVKSEGPLLNRSRSPRSTNLRKCMSSQPVLPQEFSLEPAISLMSTEGSTPYSIELSKPGQADVVSDCPSEEPIKNYHGPSDGTNRVRSWADSADSDSEMDFTEPCFLDESPAQRTNPATSYGHPDFTHLHDAIISHATSISVHMGAQDPLRAQAIEAVRTVVNEFWPHASVCVYGSMYGPAQTRLALPTSDVDLVICGLIPRSPECSDTMILEKLKERLSDAEVVLLQGRSVLRLMQGSLSVDVTVDEPNHGGLATSEFARLACEEMPLLRPLVLVVKHLLHLHGLGTPSMGGLSGYGVVILISRFLMDQHIEDPDTVDLGLLLCDLLTFYGEKFSPHRMGIRVRPGESYVLCSDVSSCPWAFQPVFIEDPEQRGNNVGATAWCFHGVQQLFAAARVVLQNADSGLDTLWNFKGSSSSCCH